MVAHGYLAFLLRASPPYRARQLQRLNEIGPERVDLLAELRSGLASLGSGFHANESLAEGFRLHSHDAHGRSEFIRLRRGPVGNPGETYDIDTEMSTETNQSTALLSELRAAFFIPEDSYYGLLFVERQGGRHIKDLLYQKLVVPTALKLQMVVRLEAFAETDDWRKELAGQHVLRITETLVGNSTSEDASTVDDLTVKVQADGGALARLSEDIKDRVFDVLSRVHEQYRVLAEIAPLESRRNIWGQVTKQGKKRPGWKTAPKSVFTVADADELTALKVKLEGLKTGPQNHALLEELQSVLPIDREDYDSRRIEVALGQERAEKTFVVEGDRLPQLVYPLQRRLTDIELQRTWEAHAERFLGSLNVTVPSGWLI